MGESQPMHASSYIHSLPKLVTDNTQPRSCSLAASQRGFSSTHSVRLWHKTLPCQSNPPHPPPSLLCRLQPGPLCVFPAQALCVQVLVVSCGMWYGGVGVRGRETGWPKGGGCAILPTHSIHPPLICHPLDHLGEAKQKTHRDRISDT